MPLMDDGYFCGLADGEGCFMLAKKRGGRPGKVQVIGVQPWFSMGLRWDDGDLLRALRDEFGGTTRFQKRSKSHSESKRQGRVIWTVAAKGDMLGMVNYFTQYPLRGKKRHDYAIWAEAVSIYVEHGARHEALPLLKESFIEPATKPAQYGRACRSPTLVVNEHGLLSRRWERRA